MAQAVRVKTGSRIHLGFIDLEGSLGRRYGSLGIYLENPCFEAVVYASKGVDAEGGLRDAVELVCRRLGIPGLSVKASFTIPPHIGLGSGTQTTLALASAANHIYRLGYSFEDIVRVMGRGRRSGAGLWLFRYGGLVVDGGRRGDELPPLLFRLPIPEEWRFVVAAPNSPEKGLSGEPEEKVFRELSAGGRLSERISRIILMKLLPALVERDADEFGQAITMIDELTGEAFQDIQGGLHSPTTAEIIRLMKRLGAQGAGQSSWGPSAYCLAGSLSEASEIAEALKSRGYWVVVSRPRNRGADITPKTR